MAVWKSNIDEFMMIIKSNLDIYVVFSYYFKIIISPLTLVL